MALIDASFILTNQLVVPMMWWDKPIKHILNSQMILSFYKKYAQAILVYQLGGSIINNIN